MAEVGKTAFITRGCSSIGRALVREFLSRGANVFLVDQDSEALRLFVNEQISLGADGRIAFAQANGADFARQAAAFDEAIKRFGDLDYVVPMTLTAREKRTSTASTISGWEKPDLSDIELNFTGILYTCSLAIQHYRRRPISSDGWKGKIICVSDICGIYPISTLPLHTAAQHGIVGYVQSYGKALIEENICLNIICPGIMADSDIKIQVHGGTESLLTPTREILEVFEKLISTYDISGEVFEVGPRGSSNQPAPEPSDEKTKIVKGILTEQGRDS